MKFALTIGISIVFLILLVIVVNNTNPSFLRVITTTSTNLKLNSLSTDKQLYHSNEIMNISLEIYAPEDIEAAIKVFGIKDKRNNYRLNKEELRNLTTGTNIISYSYKIPSCYGCAGLNPGIKQIIALVSCVNTTSNSTIEIEIKP